MVTARHERDLRDQELVNGQNGLQERLLVSTEMIQQLPELQLPKLLERFVSHQARTNR